MVEAVRDHWLVALAVGLVVAAIVNWRGWDRRARYAPDMMATLAQHWWMLAMRGGLAIALAIGLVAWPDSMLDRVLLVFAIYAAVDGVWTIASAAWLARWGLAAWPVGLEGAVSVALAGIALGWPLLPRDVVELIGVWGIVTGILEIAWAGRLAVRPAFRGLLVTAGASSLFLAGILLALPHAYVGTVVWALAGYSGIFGAAILAAAWHSRLSDGRNPAAARPGAHGHTSGSSAQGAASRP